MCSPTADPRSEWCRWSWGPGSSGSSCPSPPDQQRALWAVLSEGRRIWAQTEGLGLAVDLQSSLKQWIAVMTVMFVLMRVESFTSPWQRQCKLMLGNCYHDWVINWVTDIFYISTMLQYYLAYLTEVVIENGYRLSWYVCQHFFCLLKDAIKGYEEPGLYSWSWIWTAKKH